MQFLKYGVQTVTIFAEIDKRFLIHFKLDIKLGKSSSECKISIVVLLISVCKLRANL